MTDELMQLVLDLGHRPALGAEDFLVGPSNQAAVALVDRWPDWPLSSALVVGPPRSGKSHLAHVWQLRSNAVITEAAAIGETIIPVFKSRRALVVEDIDNGIEDERALFHLLNLAREEAGHLLLTSTRPAGEIDIALPDLRSRLRALPMVRIEVPDDTLLRTVLVKQFSDRQLAVEPHVVEHIARRSERSMAAVEAIVAEIDRVALATHRKVTRSLAGEVLARMGGVDLQIESTSQDAD